MRVLWIILAVLVLASCSDDTSFRIEGHIEGNPTTNIYYAYYDGTRYVRGVAGAVDGKFSVGGSAPYGALVDFSNLDRTVIGRAWVQNGQTVSLEMPRKDMYGVRASGNAESATLNDFYRDNADSLRQNRANSLIEAYVNKHPMSITSAILLDRHYDPWQQDRGIEILDSLLQILEPQARPTVLLGALQHNLQNALSGNPDAAEFQSITYVDYDDTLRVFNPSDYPYSLVAVSDYSTRREVPGTFRRVGKRYGCLDLSVDADTMVWHQTTRPDSAKWERGWVAGGTMSKDLMRLGVVKTPFFIVTDSTGKQLYRGINPGKALSTLP